MKNQGTPKTLREAIKDALDDEVFFNYRAPRERELQVVVNHVKDFLAQKFTTARLAAHFGRFNSDAHVMELFELCTSDEPKEESYAGD